MGLKEDKRFLTATENLIWADAATVVVAAAYEAGFRNCLTLRSIGTAFALDSLRQHALLF